MAIALAGLLMTASVSRAAFPFRDYQAGAVLRYEMRGLNDGKVYAAVSRHEVKQNNGVFYEEVAWESLVSAGESVDLTAAANFRQRLSLDGGFDTAHNNFGEIPPQLIRHLAGPYFDLMTFYVDANPRLLGSRLRELAAGKPVLLPYGKPSSWADGSRILLGESCIDFRVTFQETVPERPMLRVEHISPENGPCASLPEAWMRAPVGDRPNNWVQVAISPAPPEGAPRYDVSYGLESFESHIFLDPHDGHILSADLHNLVDRENRSCRKAEVLRNGTRTTVSGIEECGAPAPQHTFRNVSLRLLEHRALPAREPPPR